MKNCKTCEHAVFDKVWGEYKCTVYHHRIYESELEAMEECKDYKKEPTKPKE